MTPNCDEESRTILPEAVVEAVNIILWDTNSGPEPTVDQVQIWMRELLLCADRDSKPVQEALIRCRNFLRTNNSLFYEIP